MGQDHRLTDRLTNYWTLLRKDNVMPEFAQFNRSAISDIWQQCILFTVQPAVAGKPATVNFYMVGESTKSIYSGDMTGHAVSASMKHMQGASIVKRVDEIIAAPQALYDQGQFVNEKSKVVKYRSCLLPFGSKDGRVTHILAGLSWREF
jgi:hypothetical protein